CFFNLAIFGWWDSAFIKIAHIPGRLLEIERFKRFLDLREYFSFSIDVQYNLAPFTVVKVPELAKIWRGQSQEGSITPPQAKGLEKTH
ncbi:hypothetical protein KGY58_02070, partial [Candidatus Bipolaricaulota bacterium]|nr:hypothetical protein [Candidatus Bipolaricaulota bacterium]